MVHVLAMLVFVASLVLGVGEAYADVWSATAAHEIELASPAALLPAKDQKTAAPHDCHDIGCTGLVTPMVGDHVRAEGSLSAPVTRDRSPGSPLLGRDPPVPRQPLL